MTNFTTRMMIAAATMVVAAGAASAQTLKAEIPFAFRASGKVMAAGTYRVVEMNHTTGSPVFRVGRSDGSPILLAAMASNDPKKAWVSGGVPVLTFECADTRCTLVGVWTGHGDRAYAFSRPKFAKGEPVHVATISMRVEKGD